MAAVLTTSRYIEPGVFLGEVIQPTASNLSADARVPAIIAKGSRYAVAKNVPITRAFILGEQLNFSSSPPFIAPLQHVAVGNQQLPNRLFKQDGTELRASEWSYVVTNTLAGPVLESVQIRDESFDPLVTYYLDYQSGDRAVRDQLPIANVRQITDVGLQVDQAQFKEYRDFYVPMSFTSPVNDVSNVHNNAFFSPVTLVPQVGSTGSVAMNPSASYIGSYSRKYTLTCLAIAGVFPNRQATFQWKAVNLSGGNNQVAPIPLHVADAQPQFLVNEAVPSSLTQAIEMGVIADFSFGVTNFAAGDVVTLVANGPSLVEIDGRYANPQFAKIADPVLVTGSVGDLLVQISKDAQYLNFRNHTFRLKLLNVSGATPNRQYTFVWARYGDTIVPANGTFTVLENTSATHSQPLADSVKVDFVFGTVSPIAGAMWDIRATTPRLNCTAKDSRSYKLNVSSLSTVGSVTTVVGGFNTDTTEGRFGTFQAIYDANGVLPKDGYSLLPDNVSLAWRNLPSSPALQDIFTFGVIDSELMDWNLQAQVTDIRQLTDFQTDLNGSITGQAGLKYVILSQIPTDGMSIRVVNFNTGADISFNHNVGTPFIFFNADPGVPIEVTYLFRGAEPDPGQVYYVTATFLRPDAYYNAPFLVLRLDDGRNFAAPSGIDNDLYIGNEIAWDNNAPAVYLIQAQNKDGSGFFSKPDFQNAIRSIRSYKRITDLCLLNFSDGLSDLLNENVLANDPFQRRPNLLWWGAPISTPIGDENTEGSLVYLAQRSLRLSGQSAAKGTRIMMAPTQAKKTIVLANGLTSQVTLDGSFLALAAAARVASFADPATDILRTQINGFDFIQIYSDEENAILGQAQVLYAKGSPSAYFWGEDYTTDTTKNFERIQLMTQRQFVVKVVVREMDTLIGITPASGEAAKTLIRGQLASILRGLLAKGLIAPYQDNFGNERAFDPNKDIIVFQDQNDLSLFYFNFAWFSRNVIKRLLGLYALNSNDFSTGVALQ